ncbi:DUF5134 domain-containing protein [Kitasatospora sp. NPDC088346]|uniref:DUF5134 domain-containing protein n=1 Tax=Kitasatospora sp. NPDC088346 TaxID=3364073 RepID=UPI003804956C
MHGPALVTWLVAALAVGAAALCLVRLRGPRPGCGPGRATRPDGPAAGHRRDRESDAAEALMALGMAGMTLLPGPLWGWLFTVPAGALLLGALGPAGPRTDHGAGPRAHRLHHGVGALAMVYMALAMGSGPAHPHHAAAPGLPAVTGLLLVYFGGYSLWSGSRLLSPAPAGPHPGRSPAPAPIAPAPIAPTPAGPARALAVAGGLGPACRVAMGIGMFAMLLTM